MPSNETQSLARLLLSPTDEMLRVSLATEWPALYREHLRHPSNGPNTAAENERRIERERRRFAAIAKALGQ